MKACSYGSECKPMMKSGQGIPQKPGKSSGKSKSMKGKKMKRGKRGS